MCNEHIQGVGSGREKGKGGICLRGGVHSNGVGSAELIYQLSPREEAPSLGSMTMRARLASVEGSRQGTVLLSGRNKRV